MVDVGSAVGGVKLAALSATTITTNFFFTDTTRTTGVIMGKKFRLPRLIPGDFAVRGPVPN